MNGEECGRKWSQLNFSVSNKGEFLCGKKGKCSSGIIFYYVTSQFRLLSRTAFLEMSGTADSLQIIIFMRNYSLNFSKFMNN
jgi:hypothetical protein